MTAAKVTHTAVLSSQAVYVRNYLLEQTTAKDSQDVLRNALRLHTTAIRGHKKKSNLFSSRDGKTPFPIHLLAPRTQVRLPPEADLLQPVTFTMDVAVGTTTESFDELFKFAETDDISVVIENALFFHYDLIQRENDGEHFFVRGAQDRKLHPVSLFASKSHNDDGDEPDGPAA